MGLKVNPFFFFFSCPITSPVASISRAVHTALSILHQILWWRKASSQTYKRKWWSWYIYFDAKRSIWTYCRRMNPNEKRLTKFISFSSHFSSNLRWNLSDVSEWRVDKSLVKVLLGHLSSQSFRCTRKTSR